MFDSDSPQDVGLHGIDGYEPGPPAPSPFVLFEFLGEDIEHDENSMISLSELWGLAGSPPGLDPLGWLRGGGRALAAHIAASVLSPGIPVAKLDEGPDGPEILASSELAAYYAQHLSPEFAYKVVDAFDEWTDQEIFPDNHIQRGIEVYLRGGDDEASVEQRLKRLLRDCVERCGADHRRGLRMGTGGDGPRR